MDDSEWMTVNGHGIYRDVSQAVPSHCYVLAKVGKVGTHMDQAGTRERMHRRHGISFDASKR